MQFPSSSRKRVIMIGVLEPLMFSTENGHTVTPPPLFKKVFRGETAFYDFLMCFGVSMVGLLK